jgi:N-acetyl-D-muramate 6-phosphate phosphatase
MTQVHQAILFDLDGTLLDTAPEFAACMNRLLGEHAKAPIEVEGLRSSVSHGVRGMLAYAFQSSPDDPDYAQLHAQFLEYYKEGIGSQTVFFSGIPTLIASLQKANLPWGIVTNKPTEFTLPLVQKFSPLNQALCVISGDSLSVSKPHPAPLLMGANHLGVSPQHCLYVGDARTDVVASRAAGMPCVVANYGYIPMDEDATSWEADHYVDDPKQILRLFSQ